MKAGVAEGFDAADRGRDIQPVQIFGDTRHDALLHAVG